MNVEQVYSLVNAASAEYVGETAVLLEDLSNVVELGTALFNANAVDNYVRKLVDHIGRVVFVDRPYSGLGLSVLMDSWEYGSVMEKISCGLLEASESEAWTLTDNTSYDPNIFRAPPISAKFYNNRVTFEIDVSITRKQVKSSFNSAEQLNAFVSMIYNAVERSMTVRIDGLVQDTINSMIAETLYADYGGSGYGDDSGVKAINLLYLYNELHSGSTITADAALSTPDFIRFATYIIGLTSDRMRSMSTLYNVGAQPRFTPLDRQHVILLADFKNASDAFLQSSTFHNELVSLPNADTVPFWQGSGTEWAFEDVSAINVTTAASHTVNVTGILGVIFDRDALGVTNFSREVRTHYNAKADFYNNFFEFLEGNFNDLNENMVVFFVEDATT